MVYHWAPHKEICYRMYITERRPLEEIIEHMKRVYSFKPRSEVVDSYGFHQLTRSDNSKRAYQVQFSRWNFPSKQRPAHKDDRLVKRVHELWQKNASQREMLRILKDEEGFDINSRELTRVRARNRWLLRARHGDRARPGDVERDSPDSPGDASPAQDGDSTTSLPSQGPRTSGRPIAKDVTNAEHTNHDVPAPKPRRLSKRQSRRNRQQVAGTDELVRFPSEMTLNASKDALGLDSTTYQETRECFARICQEESIIKKTLAGPDKWDYVKNRLVHERPHLQEVVWGSKARLALDIICSDVTKRLRNMDTKMTLVDAKNVLGLDPQQSREVRTSLHEVLCDAQFTCKSDGTAEEWEVIKKRWMEKCELIQDLPVSQEFRRALEVVARDVVKRKRDEKRVQGSSKSHGAGQQKEVSQPETHPDKQQPESRILQPEYEEQQERQDRSLETAESPSSAFATPDRRAPRASSSASPPPLIDEGLDNSMGNSSFEPMPEVPQNSRMEFPPLRRSMPAHAPMPIQPPVSNLPSSSGVLPQPHRMLGSSASANMSLNSQYGSPIYMGTGSQSTFMDQQYVSHEFSAAPANPIFQNVAPVSTAFAVFLRLHPSSTYATSTNLWIGTMSSQSVQELRQTAAAKFPGALCVRIEGILKDAKGTELPLQIQEDEELGAYFAHMQGGSPTFAVQLV
ncbi:hypothetical protein FDECE_4310 [Fusarium decemcellulare]|nr:hypothetical protein FDECE_4310 [Fusarium decemcellulare]